MQTAILNFWKNSVFPEVYKIGMINLKTTGAGDDNLTTKLQVNKTFTLDVISTRGAVLHIEPSTPIFLDLINFFN